MVVGDDHVEPRRLRLGDLRHGRDSAVHGHDEPAVLARKARQRLASDPVALLEAARQMPFDVRAELAEDQHSERGGADPVDVVVAVDADPLAGRDRRADRVARSGHVSEEQRIVLGGFSVEKRPRGLRLA